MLEIDTLVIGGGIQGLVALRELTRVGYGCALVTNSDLGAGQTLHSHGLLNSGVGLLTGQLRQTLEGAALPFAREHGVPLYGDDQWFMLAPPPMLDQLRPAWVASGYAPEPVEASALPAGFAPLVPVLKVKGYNVSKRRLVAALSEGLLDRIVRGSIQRSDGLVRIQPIDSDERIEVRPKVIVVAAGCGSKRLLETVFQVSSPQLARISFGKQHMICVRAPRAVLPPISALVPPGLMIVGHPSQPGGSVGADDGDVTWYVTPTDRAAQRATDAPDNARAEVDRALVAQGLEGVLRFYPSIREAAGVRLAVFAGWKQEIDDQPAVRLCELVEGTSNIILALPSVLINAWPNAVDLVAIVRKITEPSGVTPRIPHAGRNVRVGQENELESQTTWLDWNGFSRLYPR
ncbi:MAG TPA: FAD-dependent oxidoreductase [Candidatus Limnocylindria bacterium]